MAGRWISTASLLGLVLAVLGVPTVYGDVLWSDKHLNLKQGDEVIITCNIKNLGYADSAQIFKKGTKGDHVICDNMNLHDVFSNTGRYKLHVTNQEGTRDFSFKLTISNVVGADEGIIGCKKLGEGNKVVELNLRVSVPVAELNISRTNPKGEEHVINESSPVHLRQGRKEELRCSAKVIGSTKEAAMTIKIDGEDVTDVFDKKPAEIINNEKDGLYERSSIVTMYYNATNPPKEWHNKKMVCEAKVAKYDAKRTERKIEVKFKPFINCDKGVYYANVGDTVTMKCEVQAHPTADEIKWNVDSNSTSVKYHQKNVEPGKKEVTLTIHNVTMSHFKVYKLTARNKLGSEEIEVQVTRVGTPPIQTTQPHSSKEVVPRTTVTPSTTVAQVIDKGNNNNGYSKTGASSGNVNSSPHLYASLVLTALLATLSVTCLQ